MNKLLIIDKDNKMLLSMDETDEEIAWKIIIDKSIEITTKDDSMIIKLREDYWTHWNAKVKIVDWEIMFEVYKN